MIRGGIQLIELNKEIHPKPNGWNNNRLHFFKYISESTAKVVLANRTLRWSSSSNLNDPFEMQLSLDICGDRERIKEMALERMWQIYSTDEPFTPSNPIGVVLLFMRQYVKNMTKIFFHEKLGAAIEESFSLIDENAVTNEQAFTQYFSDLKILSMTVRPDISLMWSHYANSHQGVVLRFRNVPEKDSPYGMAMPMNYTPDPPALFTEEYLINSFCGIETLDIRKTNDAVIYRKAPEWEYEQEWRISGGLGRKRGEPFEDNLFGADELDGVIFGLRTTDANKDEIRQLCGQYPNIQFMQASLQKGKGVVDINVVA